MKIIIFLTLLIFANLEANDDYSFRVAFGKATTSNLSEIISGDIGNPPRDYYVYGFDAGYLISKDFYDLPIDFYAQLGLGIYDEDGAQKTVYESTLYIKVFWKIDFLDNRVRLGLGEGISYTSRYLQIEWDEAMDDGDNYSKYLNYLDLSIDFDLGRLTGVRSLKDTYIGWTIKHRSGVWGLFNSVEEGGVNYNTISITKNF